MTAPSYANQNGNKRFLILIVFVVGGLITLYVLLNQPVNNQDVSLITQDTKPSHNIIDQPQTNKNLTQQESDGVTSKSAQMTGVLQDDETSQSNNSSGDTNNSGLSGRNENIQMYPLGLGCLSTAEITCVITTGDPLYKALGKDQAAGLLINGVKVNPTKIILQTDLGTYTDEPTQDYQGIVLTSSRKEYDSETGTLTLTVGANAQYHNGLKAEEQRVLYIAQVVRSFMAMFEEPTENYIEVNRAVSELASWQPTLTQQL